MEIVIAIPPMGSMCGTPQNRVSTTSQGSTVMNLDCLCYIKPQET